jgi:hypothetical protein
MTIVKSLATLLCLIRTLLAAAYGTQTPFDFPVFTLTN